jgi:hypothetical protein
VSQIRRGESLATPALLVEQRVGQKDVDVFGVVRAELLVDLGE